MSNKNKGKNKRTSSVSVDQSAAKKKKNAPASTPSKTRQNQVEKTLPELSSDDSLTDLIHNTSPTAASNTSITNKDDIEKPIELPHFTFDDMNKLLDNVKKALPDNDILKFNTRLDKLDWEKVKFDNFSADDCRKLVIYAISFTRKFKTLSEILSDAKVSATKPNSKIYRQSNKDSSKPRHPSSSYMIFANEIRDKLRKQHPNLSIIEIGKLIGEKWRQLADSKKEKYVKKFEENKKVYLEEISKYNIEHNHQPVNQKKKDLDKPRTPLSIYLSEKLEKDDNPDLEGKTLKEKQIYYKAKYNQLSDKKKFKYIKKCMDAEEQFVEKLKDKLKTSNVDYKTVLNKNERDIVEKMNGKPENPAANGYALFIKENITKPEIANVEPKQRNQLLATKWKELSKNERDDYNSRAKSMQEKFANDMQIYAKNLPEKEAIELYMSNTIPSFAKEILQKRIESFAN